MVAQAIERDDIEAPKPVREVVGGEPYEFYPLGDYVVSAPEVCRGRPTVKYTRVEVTGILDLLATGWTIEEIVADYDRPEISREAVEEALSLAGKALLATSRGPRAKAA